MEPNATAELLATEVDLLLADLFPANAKQECRPCGGSGTVLVDPNDRRKGETTCPNCRGLGEL